MNFNTLSTETKPSEDSNCWSDNVPLNLPYNAEFEETLDFNLI
jgi:hypothetical protein